MNELVIGRRGLGKSTLADAEARRLNPKRIYFDPGDQFQSSDYRVESIEKFRELMEDDYKWEPGKELSISYVPPTSVVEMEWNRFAFELWNFTGIYKDAASYVLTIDESHELQSAQYINDWLARFIRRAPRRERGDPNPVDMIQTTHNPQDLNRLTFSQSDEVYIFNMFDRRALKAIADQWGEEVAEQVKSLRTPKTGGRDVLQIDAETGTFRVIDDPKEWFRNIRQKPEGSGLPGGALADYEEIYGDD